MSEIHKIFIKASRGALILTANKRLFRYLREKYDLWMQEQGKSAWATPQIYSYEGWLSLCLDKLGESWRLLNPHQERYLWEQQIENSSRGTPMELLQLSQTADQALKANHLLKEYDLLFNEDSATEDQRMFLTWRKQYQSSCEQYGWIDKSDVIKRICTALEAGTLTLTSQLILVGFDQLTPGLELLLAVAENKGTECEISVQETRESGKIIRFPAQDKRHEVESAALWTRRLLEQGETSIGIVVPDLVRQRRLIERVFLQQIDPLASVSLGYNDTAFSLSLGGALAEQGVIHAAITLLNIDLSISVDQISFLLRSPYLGGALKEADARALFDRKLRSYKQKSFRLTSIIAQTEKNPGLSLFHRILKTIRTEIGVKSSASPGLWAQRFADHLHALGWPGERTVVSSEYQAVTAWRVKVVEAMVMLDTIKPSMPRYQALNLLRQISNETEFQLEAPTGAVQVVGLLESSGLYFQHLWVMGMNETLLPARPQPNPFIPFALQEKYGMPHASAERELQFAEQVVERLQSASPDIVFSFVTREGDCSLRPSPLIEVCGEIGRPVFAASADPLSVIGGESDQQEQWLDNRGPGLQAGVAEGGIAILKDQAHCPFRAFVHHRLHCRALEEPVPGISAIMRGDLVHLALEHIWNQLGHRENLIRLAGTELDAVAHTQVENALKAYFQNRVVVDDFLLELEAERIEKLILEWLTEVETGRENFKVIATERQLVSRIGELQVRIKVDRIDQLEDGSRIIIDYKTGTDFKADDFLSSPLIEPQLPVYAIADVQNHADGVAFAQVRKGGCRFVGIVREKGLLGRVKDLSGFSQADELDIHDWAELLVVWKREIHQLAEDFVSGKADVSPYDLERSCRFCDLMGICRIQETVSISGSADE